MIGNSPIQIINSEKAVGTIISKFSTDFIMDVIQDNIRMRFRPFNVGPANFPAVIEQDIKMAKLEHPAYIRDFDETRLRKYKEIVDMIAKSYGLTVSPMVEDYTPDQMFSLAYILFDIFVSNFTPKMINFFVQYIINNKDDIYTQIPEAEEIRKNKEAISYGKKLFIDPKLIVIHSALVAVLDNIAAHDIPFQQLLYYLVDRPTADWLASILADTGDIYKYQYASYILNPVSRPDMFTAIKLQIQNVASEKSIDIQNYSSE